MSGRFRLVCLSLLIAFSIVVVASIARSAAEWQVGSVYKLEFLLGSSTYSLLHGQGLLVCNDPLGRAANSICFKSARMPLASSIAALGVEVFGDRPKPIILLKNFLLLLPLWAAMALVLQRARPTRQAVVLSSILLALPFFILNYLTIVINLEWEEGYIFGVIVLALVLLFFGFSSRVSWILQFGLTLDLLFISKSSMLPVVAVLLVASLMKLPTWDKRVVLAVLVGLAPLGWAIYQHHASGRFAVGTSLDGLNLEKGNNARFQERYPPKLYSLDAYDWELSQGHYFVDEWAANDYHMAQGKSFILTHPAYTAASDWIKARVILLTFDRYGVKTYGRGVTLAASAGMVIFRLLLWSSLLLGLYSAITGQGIGRFAGITYLLFVAAYCLPYIVGFGYMRHAIVLAYPSAIAWCLALRGDEASTPR